MTRNYLTWASNSILQADFAIRLFQKQQGRPPSGLNELIPKYLPSVPIDPYSGKPLCYRLQDTEWAVYSVGRDLEDNGGKFANLQTFVSVLGYDFDADTPTRP